MSHHLTVVPRELLRTKEVAKRLQVSTRTVLTWADEGLIPSIVTPGGHRRYPASGVEQVHKQMFGHPGH